MCNKANLKILSLTEKGTMRLGTRVCVPDVDELRKEIMEEAHFLLTAFLRVLPKYIIT